MKQSTLDILLVVLLFSHSVTTFHKHRRKHVDENENLIQDEQTEYDVNHQKKTQYNMYENFSINYPPDNETMTTTSITDSTETPTTVPPMFSLKPESKHIKYRADNCSVCYGNIEQKVCDACKEREEAKLLRMDSIKKDILKKSLVKYFYLSWLFRCKIGNLDGS